MKRTVLYAKIHRATVTQTEVEYEGSVTVDPVLLDAAGIAPYEKVLIANISNGSRLETYCIEGEPGDGTICLNGAAARLAQRGDKVIIIAFASIDESELAGWKPRIVKVDEDNRPVP